MKRMRKKNGLSILLAMMLVMTTIWSTGMVAYAMDTVIVAPENMLNVQVVDKDGNIVYGMGASMLNEDGVECAAWNVNQSYKNSSSSLVERNGSGITVGRYFYEPRSTFAALVAPGNLVYVRQEYGSGYSSYEGDVYFELGQERELTLGYMPVQETAFQVPPNTLMINADAKLENACYDLYIGYGENEMIANSMAGSLTGVSMPANCTMNIYGKFNGGAPQSYNMSFDKATEYVKVRRKLADIASRFNEDGTLTCTPLGEEELELTLEIASGTYRPGEVYLHIISGAVINYPVPDDEGYIEFYVEKKTGEYKLMYDMHYNYITANGGYAGGGGGGSSSFGYACEKVVKNFKAIDIPETGTTLYNVSAGNYTINLSNVPRRYMNPGPITVNVTKFQDIQELKIVLEDMHDHVFGTEYKKDATNHWKECACGEKSGVEAHNPGPAATEESAQTCTVCGYEIAPKLDHDFGTEYKKDATNHWKECACGEKSGVEAHNPGPAATEESAQTCTVCGYEIAPKLDHDFGTEYNKDATKHWKECACGEKSGVEAHVPGPEATEQSTQTCIVCGYEIAPKLDHDFGTEYKKDATNHWKECACGEKSGVEAHNPGPAATEESAQTCTVCGYEIAPKLDHDFGTEYKKDATNHWKECACGEKSGVEAHVPGPEATEQNAQTCTVCGYEIVPKLGHDFGTEYKKDATNHWKECACGEKSGVEAHVPGPEATEQNAQTCIVCGYEIAPKLDHDFGTEYKKDATNHWKECACGEKSGVEAHNPGPAATEESAQTCTVCGYEIASKLDHDFGTEYKKDATNHWKECACGEKSGVEAHNPGPAATEESAQTCTVCGYEIAPKLDHDFGTEYKKDATNHWKECACGEKTGVEAHIPGPAATEDNAQTCTVCGYEIAPVIVPEEAHTHSFSGYKYNDSEHWGECSCGLRSQMLPHEFEWIVDKNATQQEAGSKHQECTYCHYSRPAVEIAKLGITSPKTGDNACQWILLLAGISGMLGMGTLAYRKKEK